MNTIHPVSDCSTAGGVCQTNIVNYILRKTNLNGSKLTTAITFGGTPGVPSAYACNVQPVQGCWVNVALQYPFSFNVSMVRLNAVTFSSSSQMVIASQYATGTINISVVVTIRLPLGVAVAYAVARRNAITDTMCAARQEEVLKQLVQRLV